MLEPALLCILLAGPAHGYALVEQLDDFGLETVSLRRVYRMLQRMEEMGWVTSDWESGETQGPPRGLRHRVGREAGPGGLDRAVAREQDRHRPFARSVRTAQVV